jgi:polysaccharide export outer membrane protein
VALLAGCAAAPGFHGPGDAGEDWVGEGSGVAPPEITPITPEVLLELAKPEAPQASPVPGQVPGEADYSYRVGPNDVLNIIVWNHPELSNPMGQFQDIEKMGRLVHQDGTIFYPFAGEVRVAGRTVQQIQQILAERLVPYVEDPQVSVRVAGFRSKKVYVTGEVNKPGTFPVTDVPLTILDAINRAGGLTEKNNMQRYGADKRLAILTRDGRRYPIDLLALYAHGKGNRVLRAGDVLHVPDNSDNKVFVMGEVNRQTSVLMNKGRLSLAEAISEANGFDLNTANTGGVYVIRGTLERNEQGQRRVVPRIFRLDASHAGALMMASRFPLQPQDVVYVDTNDLVRWNRVMSQILPTIRAAYQTKILTEGIVIE